ncbi:hypothetical protein C2W64_00675 [Brevibacillus laterosporus]|nr:hypothetical protein C2W64_00675 [Brevibacillus laterosporus]
MHVDVSKQNDMQSLAELTCEAFGGVHLQNPMTDEPLLEQVAQLTFEAIRGDHFYILTDPASLHGVQLRMEDILQGRNPSLVIPPVFQE